MSFFITYGIIPDRITCMEFSSSFSTPNILCCGGTSGALHILSAYDLTYLRGVVEGKSVELNAKTVDNKVQRKATNTRDIDREEAGGDGCIRESDGKHNPHQKEAAVGNATHQESKRSFGVLGAPKKATIEPMLDAPKRAFLTSASSPSFGLTGTASAKRLPGALYDIHHNLLCSDNNSLQYFLFCS